MVKKMDDFVNDVVKALRCAAQSGEYCYGISNRLGCKEGCPYYQDSYDTDSSSIGFDILLKDAADIISGKYGGINNDRT